MLKAISPLIAALGLVAFAPCAAAQVFSNSAPITINAANTASPYPSVINVSGAPTSITTLRVTLDEFTHPIASDVDILLVAPGGQSVVIMSDVSGAFDGVDIIIAADGLATISSAGGVFRATDFASSGADVFPAPAPTSLPVPMSSLIGTNPNGVWSLYVVDDTSGNAGSIADGWRITINGPATPASYDPGRFTYQGRLTDAAGAPITTPVTLAFSIWDHPTSTHLSNRTHAPFVVPSVQPGPDGTVTAEVDMSSLAFQNSGERFLEVGVSSPTSAPMVPLSPRTRFTDAPRATYADEPNFAQFSFNATNASAADTAATAVSAQAVGAFTAVGTALHHTDPTPDLSLSGGGVLVLGHLTGSNLGLDANEIMARSNGGDAALFLNANGGGVGIGTTAMPLETHLALGSGQFAFRTDGTALKPGGGTWTAISDPRVKQNVRPMRGTLDRLLTLNGYEYEYNDDRVKSGEVLPGVQIGLMADEVERIFPDWVSRDEHGFRYVTERSTTALMVEALRDLRAEKDEQLAKANREIAELREQLAELRRLVQQSAAPSN